MAVTGIASIPTLGKLNVVELSKVADFKAAVLKILKPWLDNPGNKLHGSDVLMATYVEPEKTAGGIIVPQTKTHEARFQGKIGLVVKLGPTAFKYDGQYEFEGDAPKIGDYVMFHASAPRELSILGTSCKLIDSSQIKMTVEDPTSIW